MDNIFEAYKCSAKDREVLDEAAAICFSVYMTHEDGELSDAALEIMTQITKFTQMLDSVTAEEKKSE